MFPRLSVAILAALTVTACADISGPSRLSLAQLAGTWNLSRLEMVLASDTSVHQDVKASYGIRATLTINRDGSAVLVAEAQGQPSMTLSATITLRGDTLTYETEGSTFETVIRLTGRTMTWLAVQTSLWDMDGDGTPEDVFERDVWQRQ
jgi:hypothetical protein